MSRNNDIWQRKPAGLVLGLDFSGGRLTSPTGHTATLNNGAATSGRTAVLDGTNDYLEVSDAPEFSFTNGAGVDQPGTLALWVNRASQTGQRVLLAKGFFSGGNVLEYQFGIGNTGTGRPFMVLYGNAAGTIYIGRSCTSALSAGVWQHVAMSYSASETSSGVKIFIDSVQSDTADVAAGVYTGTTNTVAPFRVGSIFPGFDSLGGSVADIHFYNRALTQPEIAQIYNAGAARIALGGTP